MLPKIRLLRTLSASILLMSASYSLNAGDSLFIELNAQNIPYCSYTLKENQSIYTIARMFGLETQTILNANPELDPRSLPTNVQIQVPLVLDLSYSDPSLTPVYYKVRPKESLYAICKRLFNLPIQEIRRINHLENDNLKVGQLLLLGYLKLNFSSQDQQIIGEQKTTERNEITIPNFNREQRGVAYWEAHFGNSNQYYALHKFAALNSYIEVSNPFLNRKVYAKVVGRLSNETYPREINVVVSQSVAKAIGAVDRRFFAEVRYRKP